MVPRKPNGAGLRQSGVNEDAKDLPVGQPGALQALEAKGIEFEFVFPFGCFGCRQP
jgi:hypothetical protein